MKVRSLFAIGFQLVAMGCFLWLIFHASLSVYLLRMGRGQVHIIMNSRDVKDVLADSSVDELQKEKLRLVDAIKQYSVDSLGYKPTRNFTTYYDQQGQPLLWVLTACKPFAFEAYHWKFPLIGSVSYKGFFDRRRGLDEYLGLLRKGYDAELSTVSAWSTLGWLPDPVLSSMLKRSKGRLAALLFHELFHATYYAPSSVSLNENLANFVAYKATLQFLRGDTAELRQFIDGMRDDSIYNAFTMGKLAELKRFYIQTATLDSLARLQKKEVRLRSIYLQASRLPLSHPQRYAYLNKSILAARNTFFIDAQRYDGLYDSLDNLLNTRYKGSLRQMVSDLKK